MPIISLKATIECEGCGTHFRVNIDTGDDIPEDWDLPMLIKDQVRGGSCEHLDKKRSGGLSSVQADMMLCGWCTRIADNIGEEDHLPTEAEIDAAIGQALADEARHG